ncbi:cohesin loading factor [Tuber indicum]|nr:cohesin loading factor [Tuber indicum]
MTTPNGGAWYNSGPGPSYSNNSNGYGSNPYHQTTPIAPGRQQSSTPIRLQPPPPSTNRYSNFEITIPVNRWPASHSNSGTPNTPSTPSNSMDPHLTLISMAEGYFEAAHASGYRAALAKGGGDAKAYYKLIATGLRALEAALQCRLQPRLEAMVRLRYAGILHEETENGDEAEDALNKGIMLAQRGNFTDIKYTMQHLLARIMLRTTPKASLKMLNSCIADSETLDMVHWTYSFRFLRCNILMEDSPLHDEQGAITTLQKISGTAAARHDHGIYLLASLMETMISVSSGADGIEAANRALARANSLQLESMQGMEQLGILRQMLDIMCSLMAGRYSESEVKVKVLHGMLDHSSKAQIWTPSGEFEILINPVRLGRPEEKLKFKWLTKEDIFVLGYFISGLCKFQKNVEEVGRGEKYLQEGLRSIERLLKEDHAGTTSLVGAMNKSTWRQTLKCHVMLYHTFLLCVRTDWDGAIKGFNNLQQAFSVLPPRRSLLPTLITYLQAVISHGTNQLDQALELYKLVYTTVQSPDSEISIISKLNSIIILRPRDSRAAEHLMTTVEKPCTSTKNYLMKAAYMAVKATERGELVKTKNYLSLALQLATQTTNQQLTFILLSFMCHRFFSGVVSEQAEKSARAALQNATRGRDSLWSLMGGEMFADCLARKGNEYEAMRQRDLNEEPRNAVVANLTRHMLPDEHASRGVGFHEVV